jgi:hypothetical protein
MWWLAYRRFTPDANSNHQGVTDGARDGQHPGLAPGLISRWKLDLNLFRVRETNGRASAKTRPFLQRGRQGSPQTLGDLALPDPH